MSAPNTDPDDFQAVGFCLFEEVLQAEEIAGVRADLDELVRDMPDTMVVYKDGEHKEVAARPEYLTEPHAKQACWLELCRHPRVLDAVEALLGTDLIPIMSHPIVKIGRAHV